MPANYHRVWVRFRKSDVKRRLKDLQRELSEKTSKKVSTSKLVETIVEQFLDKNYPISLLEESS